MASTVADLCRLRQITFEQLVERSGMEETRVAAIVMRRWTPSPGERARIAAVFGVATEEIIWGHATPVQHIYGQGPA
jgi:transcriptional regulator with XRE-family HTH domain